MVEIDVNILRRVMSLVMVEEEPDRYIDDVRRIIELFDELDRFDIHIKDLEPLYHPLGSTGRLREDAPEESGIEFPGDSDYRWEDYIEAPPIRGRRELG